MTNNQLTDEQIITLQLRIMSALSFYQQRPEREAKRMAELLMLAGTAASELQERRKADSELVAVREPIAWLNDAYLARGVVDGEAGSEDAGPGYIPVYREAQSAPVAPEEMPCGGAADDYHDGYQDGWNACRSAMLQAEPVTTANKLGNSPAIPDGYVMVPKEPTDEMQSAGASAIRIETTALNKLWTGNAVFRAMLAAAPQEVSHD